MPCVSQPQAQTNISSKFERYFLPLENSIGEGRSIISYPHRMIIYMATMNGIGKSVRMFGKLSGRTGQTYTYIVTKRFMQNWPEVEPLDKIFMPPNIDDRLLPLLPYTPIARPENANPGPIKHPKADIDMRGPERIHNQLIYRQYGIIALGGGALTGPHIDVIRDRINKYMNTERFFAIWRIEPPWKAVSKKSMGKKLGGGKAKVHHYETPIKAGRVIVEVGGIGQYEEVKRILETISNKMPLYAMPISQKIMDDLKAEKLRLDAENYNPFEYRYLLRNNFSNSQRNISIREMLWGGTYF